MKGDDIMKWELIKEFPNKNFNLWRNITAGYNETFKKDIDPNVCRKKTILELEMSKKLI